MQFYKSCLNKSQVFILLLATTLTFCAEYLRNILNLALCISIYWHKSSANLETEQQEPFSRVYIEELDNDFDLE